MPLMSSGTTIFLVREWNVEGEWMKPRQNLTSFISFSAYLRYQASSAIEPPLASDIRNGNSPAPMMIEPAGLIAGVDVGDVGDAVARHVVMVERLAELLGREHLVLDGAAGSFSTAAPQSSSAFCSGCEAGTQCDISARRFSCANAGVTPAASSSANNAFLIGHLPLAEGGLGAQSC